MPSSFPYSASSELVNINDLPFKFTFNGIPLGTHLIGFSAEFNSVQYVVRESGTNTFVSFLGNAKMPFSVVSGDTEISKGMMFLQSANSMVTSALSGAKTYAYGKLDVYTLPSASEIVVRLLPGSYGNYFDLSAITGYIAGSAVLLGER